MFHQQDVLAAKNKIKNTKLQELEEKKNKLVSMFGIIGTHKDLVQAAKLRSLIWSVRPH